MTLENSFKADPKSAAETAGNTITRIPVIGFFWNKSFLHYTWVGGAYSLLNIFLLWLFIDVFGIPTVLASTLVIGGTFILRYVMFRVLKIM